MSEFIEDREALMEFEEFVRVNEAFWDEHISKRHDWVERSGVFLGKRVVLYPSILLCTQTPNFFIAELVGADKCWTGLTTKRHRAPSVERYFNQFDTSEGEPVIEMEGRGYAITGLALIRPADDPAFVARFPYVRLGERKSVVGDAAGPLLRFTPEATINVFDDVLLVNRHESCFRVKHLGTAIVASSAISAETYLQELTGLTTTWKNFHPGLLFRPAGRAERELVAAQLAGLFLSPGLHETTIGEFIKLHPAVVRLAFNTDDFKYEPSFDWVDGSHDPNETSINPDLLIRRSDGAYDIVDLKTALLTRNSITRAPRRRRRLIDPVYEGAAQLAHYAEYFTTPGNAQLARERYGVQVRDPRLILVVGNRENVTPDHVREALRAHKAIEIMDYDTMAQLYARAESSPEEATPASVTAERARG